MAWRVARYLVGSLVVLGLAACGHQWLAERDAWRHEAELTCLKSGQVKESASLIRIEPINGPGTCGADFPLKVSAIGTGAPIGFDEELRPPGGIPGAPAQPLANAPYAPRVTAPAYQPYPQQAPQYSQAYPQVDQQAYPPQSYPAQYPAQTAPAPAYPPQSYPPQPYPQAAPAPMRLSPPGVAPPGVAPPEPEAPAEDDGPDNQVYQAPGGAPYRPPPRAAGEPQLYPQSVPAPQNAPLAAYPPATPVPLGRERAPVTTGAVTVQPAATLACPIVSSLDTWFATGVQPAAMKWFGAPVAEIKQISAYSCRGMNGQPGAHISEHAFGNALDIAAFILSNGRRISVQDGWHGAPEEQGFLRDVQGSACQLFTTVLAPGSNVYHYNHIHVDLMRRASGRVICQPQAIPGDVVAARAGYRYARGEPGFTGSIKPQEARESAQESAKESKEPKKTVRKASQFRMLGRDEVYDGLPAAVPGED
jgi:hypothetical protein